MSAPVVVFTLLLATAVALVTTPLLRRYAHARGWIDRPDGGRKQHPGPVPRIGGVAVFAGFACACAALAVNPGIQPTVLASLRFTGFHVLVAGALVLGIGLIDDVRGVRAATKLGVQIVAAGYLYWSGFRITSISDPLGGGALDLGALSLPLTLLWFVGVSNAFNLIDGMDGLATGIALCATATLFVAASANGRFEIALLAAALGGALLGFLRYNFSPASIFLGDSGALFVGMALAAFAVRGNMKSSTAIAIAAPLLALAVPLLDTVAALFRRVLQGKPVFQADADHIHHHLLRRGMSPVRVVIILYAAAAGFGVLSLLAVAEGNRGIGLAVFVTSAVVWVGVQQVGYDRLARSFGLLGRRPPSQVHTEGLRIGLEAADSFDELWRRLTLAAAQLGFDRLDLASSPWTQQRIRLCTAEPPAGFPTWQRDALPSARAATQSWTIPLVSNDVDLGVLELQGPLATSGGAASGQPTAEAIAVGFSRSLHRLLALPSRHYTELAVPVGGNKSA